MALVETKELTLTKIGGNSSMATPQAKDLKDLDEISALKASARHAREQNKKLAKKAVNSEAITLELPNNASDLEEMINLSGGNVNSIVVWRIDGDVDFYLPWNRVILPSNDVTDETPPRHSMRDFDLPAADLQLIAGDPKIISINGTRYKLGNQEPPTYRKGEKLTLDDLSNPPALSSPTFLKVGGNSEFTTPDSKTLAIRGEQGEKAALSLSAKRAREINKRIAIGELPKQTAGKTKEATNLAEILELSGGEINAIFVWRIDGDVDFYLPENRKIIPADGVTEDTAPKWAMRDFDLPAADLQLIAGDPKIVSINGTRYTLGNNS